jgi:hypothetical protein
VAQAVKDAGAAIMALKAKTQAAYADHWGPHSMYVEDQPKMPAVQKALDEHFFNPVRPPVIELDSVTPAESPEELAKRKAALTTGN